jgi:hypothetical protein
MPLVERDVPDFVQWLKKLESGVQSVLDASLPNKQQHKAASKLVSDKFHTAWDQLTDGIIERS